MRRYQRDQSFVHNMGYQRYRLHDTPSKCLPFPHQVSSRVHNGIAVQDESLHGISKRKLQLSQCLTIAMTDIASQSEGLFSFGRLGYVSDNQIEEVPTQDSQMLL
jgi:hypothetical protein